MAVTVDATVGGASANSYATVAEVTAYFNSRLRATGWSGAASGDKDIAVVQATALLDEWVDWWGSKVGLASDQALRWPRYGITDRDGEVIDSDVIPQLLKDAVAEQAKAILAEDLLTEPDTKGYSELKVGELSLKVDKDDRDLTGVIPDVVKSIVENFGTVRSRSNTGAVKVSRA